VGTHRSPSDQASAGASVAYFEVLRPAAGGPKTCSWEAGRPRLKAVAKVPGTAGGGSTDCGSAAPLTDFATVSPCRPVGRANSTALQPRHDSRREEPSCSPLRGAQSREYG
jgi:hypothetical protein